MKYSISKKQILSESHNDDGVDIAAGVAAMDSSMVKPRLSVVSPDQETAQADDIVDPNDLPELQ